MSDMGYHWTPCRGSGATVAAVAIGAAVLIGSGALAAAVAAVTELLMIVLACGVAAVVIVTVAAVLLWRRYGYQPPSVPEQRAAAAEFRDAERLRAMQRRPLRQITAPAPQFHLHFHGNAQPDLPVLRQALTEGDQR